uniref:NADH-ubiquinone oxidoreductase chain 6 n=1 Tax=Chelonarium sp. MJTNT-2012 TaxID=1131600 RepID=H9BJW9_9COLE|nr:NADH dehydrogenase subunit 6 [Chelonarium sp. MJTNT-2012]
MMTMTMMIMLTLTMSFLLTKHPLSMGMNLLLMTVTVAIMTGMMFTNTWFSYIMFMIMIGGMLVLFIYMTSIASNEKFKFSMKTLMIMMTLMMMSATTILIDQNLMNTNIKSEEITKALTKTSYEMMLTKFMNMPMSMIMTMLIIYLLIAMIATVKITNINKGPLRKL